MKPATDFLESFTEIDIPAKLVELQILETEKSSRPKSPEPSTLKKIWEGIVYAFDSLKDLLGANSGVDANQRREMRKVASQLPDNVLDDQIAALKQQIQNAIKKQAAKGLQQQGFQVGEKFQAPEKSREVELQNKYLKLSKQNPKSKATLDAKQALHDYVQTGVDSAVSELNRQFAEGEELGYESGDPVSDKLYANLAEEIRQTGKPLNQRKVKIYGPDEEMKNGTVHVFVPEEQKDKQKLSSRISAIIDKGPAISAAASTQERQQQSNTQQNQI